MLPGVWTTARWVQRATARSGLLLSISLMAPLGLTHTQFFILGAVGWLTKTEKRAPNQREVADFAKLDRMMMSQVIRTLEASGSIIRREDSQDSRAWRLES